MRTVTYDIHKGMARGNALNQDPEFLWDIKNGYINKENDIQQRSGIAKQNAVAIYGTPTVTYMTELDWGDGTRAIICKAGTSWWIYDATPYQGVCTANTAYKLINSGAAFTSRDVGKLVTNTTDSTSARVTAYVSATELTLAASIMDTVGDAYTIAAGYGELVGSRTAGTRGQAVMFETNATTGKIAILFDGGKPQKVTSAYVVTDLGGSPPTDATCGWVHNGHVVMNNPGNPGRIIVSALNNPEDYTSLTPIDALVIELNFRIPNGDKFIGIRSYTEDIIMFIGEKQVVLFNAPGDCNDWNLMQIIPMSCVTNYGLEQRGNQYIIPTQTGIDTMSSLVANREIPTDDMTRNVAAYYQASMASVTSSAWDTISGVYDRVLDLYYLCFPIAAGYEILVYSFLWGQVVGRYTGITANAFCRKNDGTILIGSLNGQCYTMNSGTTDDGTAISFAITPPFYYMRRKGSYKQVREMRITVEHSGAWGLAIPYVWDTQAGATLTKTIASASLGRTIIKVSDILGRGFGLQAPIQNASSGIIINVTQWEFDVVDEGKK